MGTLVDGVRTINSVARTAILLAALAGVSYGGYLAYTNFIRPGLEIEATRTELSELQRAFQQQTASLDAERQRVADLDRALARAAAELDELALANKLLKVDHRLVRLRILDKGIDEVNGEKFCQVEYTEIDDQGYPLEPAREFRLKGQRLYLDAFIVKFDDQLIERGDALRSTSMFMFRSLFGEDDGLDGGYPLDMDSSGRIRAAAYSTGPNVSAFEQQIWNEFWAISNDPIRQRELGIRANHGQINYIDPQPGQTYEFTLRSSDGLSFRATSN